VVASAVAQRDSTSIIQARLIERTATDAHRATDLFNTDAQLGLLEHEGHLFVDELFFLMA
jgi:hypothetical protein